MKTISVYAKDTATPFTVAIYKHNLLTGARTQLSGAASLGNTTVQKKTLNPTDYVLEAGYALILQVITDQNHEIYGAEIVYDRP